MTLIFVSLALVVLMCSTGSLGDGKPGTDRESQSSNKPLRVLLISSYFVGHQIPLIASCGGRVGWERTQCHPLHHGGEGVQCDTTASRESGDQVFQCWTRAYGQRGI